MSIACEQISKKITAALHVLNHIIFPHLGHTALSSQVRMTSSSGALAQPRLLLFSWTSDCLCNNFVCWRFGFSHLTRYASIELNDLYFLKQTLAAVDCIVQVRQALLTWVRISIVIHSWFILIVRHSLLSLTMDMTCKNNIECMQRSILSRPCCARICEALW